MMKQRIGMIAVSVSLVFVATTQAGMIAEWDFTAASNQTVDLTGNGHNGTAGTGVSFDTANGATFDGTNSGDITIANADLAGMMPSDIGSGETWKMTINGIQVDGGLGGYMAIFSCRNDSVPSGAMLYINPYSNFQFHIGTGTSSPTYNALKNTAVTVTASGVYDVTLTWDGSEMLLDVNGTSASLAVSSINGSSSGNNFYFGNGGDTGTQYLFDGSIAGAKIEAISAVPEPGSIILLVTMVTGLIFFRRK